MPDMMTIGRGGGRGRGKIFAKEGADNNSGVGAGPVPVLKVISYVSVSVMLG
jgi:hypothetical protein